MERSHRFCLLPSCFCSSSSSSPGTSPLLCNLGTAVLSAHSLGSIMSWQQIQELFCLLLFPEPSLLTSSSNKPWIDFSYTRQLAPLYKTKGICHSAKRASGEISFLLTQGALRFPRSGPSIASRGFQGPQIT